MPKTNQQTHQSIDQRVNPSNQKTTTTKNPNKTTTQSISQINQPINPPINQSIKPSIHRSTSQPRRQIPLLPGECRRRLCRPSCQRGLLRLSDPLDWLPQPAGKTPANDSSRPHMDPNMNRCTNMNAIIHECSDCILRRYLYLTRKRLPMTEVDHARIQKRRQIRTVL